MAVYLSPVGGVAAQFLDNSGNVLSGGKLYTYQAGTSTPASVYTTSNGGTAHANPVVLDSAGRVQSGGEIWLQEGAQYKFVLKDADDTTIGTYDNVSGINSNYLNYTAQQEIQTATSGQTVFTLTSITYQPGTNTLSVFVDGVKQAGPGPSYAYVETSTTVVTFNAGLHVGALVEFTTAVDNSAALTGADASQISYTPAGTGAVATTVQTKLRETVSVKDFGAVGDGVTNDTAAVLAAATALGTYGTLYFPAGTYLFNVDFGSARINLRGDGIDKTILKTFTSTGYPITFSGNSSWDYGSISDLTISGSGTMVDGGVQYGTSVFSSGQQYAGRIIYTRVKFYNLNIAIHKRCGNIGNQFHQCTFTTCNYHWYAESKASPLMHAGADGFYGCHLSGAQLASIYVDSSVTGSGGLYFDSECIFELNPGFLLFCKSMAGVWMPGIIFDGCWNESNASAGSVTINSVSYTPRDFYLNTARQVAVRNMRITKAELISASLLCSNCNLDGITLVADANSCIVSDRQQADTYANIKPYSPTIQHAIRGSGNSGSTFWTRPRTRITRGWTALQQQTFAEGAVTFTGTASIGATVTQDGQLFDSCVELALPSGNTEYSSGTATLTADRWIVATIDIKLVSGAADATFKVENLSGSVTIDNTNWKTLAIVTNTFSGGGANIRPRVIGGSGTSNIRFSAYQTVEFASLQEAMAFLDGELYVAASTYPRTIYLTAAPTTGTWNVGDICVNRSPSVGNPKGWRCTVAGTPGTWVSEGNL